MHPHDKEAANVKRSMSPVSQKGSNSTDVQNEGLMLPQPSLILNATNSPVGLAAMECPVSRFWRGQHSWTLSQCGS